MNKKQILGFIFSIFFVIAIGITAFIGVKNKEKDVFVVQNTYEVLFALESYQNLLSDLQTGRRGYIISGDKQFLEPFNQAISKIDNQYELMSRLIKDNDDLDDKIVELKHAVDSLLVYYKETNELASTLNISRDTLYKVLIVGKEKMDAVRNLIIQIRETELKLLDERKLKSKESAEFAKIIIVFGSLLTLLIVVWLITNITVEFKTRKKAEELLKSNNSKLNRINKQLDEFVYVVSHDLKSPLSGITAMMTIIEEILETKKDTETADLAKMVKKSAGDLVNMVNSILAYSRISRLESPKELIKLNTFFHDIVGLLYPPKNIKITIPDYFKIISAERAPLQQVFQNLISNAIKYNDKENGEIEILVAEKGDKHIFGVRDNGIGVDKKNRQRIFQLFQTESGKRTSENTGIGLAIIKKLVEDRDGKVWLESEVGKGSTFYFEWPK